MYIILECNYWDKHVLVSSCHRTTAITMGQKAATVWMCCLRNDQVWRKMAEWKPRSNRYDIVDTTKTYRRSVLHRSGTQCVCSADLFRFRGASVLDKGSIPLTVGVWPVFVAIVKPEIQGVESCHISPCVYGTECVFCLTPRGQRTFMGITACTSNK